MSQTRLHRHGHVVSAATWLMLAGMLVASTAWAQQAAPKADDTPTGGTEQSIDVPHATAQNALSPTRNDGPAFPVDSIDVYYLESHPDQPSLDETLPIEVELQPTPTGYVVPQAGQPTETVRLSRDQQAVASFHASALAVISRALLKEVHKLGLLGVYVVPSWNDLDSKREVDLRPAGEHRLRFVVWTGKVVEVRTVAVGDRIKGDWLINNRKHRAILAKSPLQSTDLAREDTTDILNREVLEDFLFRLNRHPGRYVEASLASSLDGGGVALDYRVHEGRPWTAYAQVSNTGTERTEPWQTRFGYTHRQVTGRDDIFSLEYLNAGGKTVNGVNAFFNAPWFRKQRPQAMKTSGNEPAWIAWADRDKIPWWGSDRLRWQVGGGWSRIETGIGRLEDFQVDRVLNQDWYVAGEMVHNSWQHHAFFLDTFVNFRYRDVTTDNESNANTGHSQIIGGSAGIKMERINEYSTFLARFAAEGASADSTQNVGRTNTDDAWALLRWDVGLTYYLEALFNPKAWRDPTTARSSTLAHEFAFGTRGQYAFDYRLIPEVSQIIGGLYSVRGFDQAIATGDSVVIGSVEYRFHLPRALPIQRKPLQIPWLGDFRAAPQQVYGRPDWDLILRAFVDTGYSVRNRKSEGNNIQAEFNQTLLSAGVGIEAVFRGNMRVRVDWGRGLIQDPVDHIDPSGKFHFLFSVIY